MSFSRRKLLQMGGASAALASFLPILNSEAQEADTPKRIIFYVTHNGTIGSEYTPDGTGKDFSFRRILSPLEPYKDYVTVVGGIDLDPYLGWAPHVGQGMLLTNVEPRTEDRMGMGISLDQYLAQSIGQETYLPQLLTGTMPYTGVGGTYAKWQHFRGPADPVQVEPDPYAVFDRVFAGSTENNDGLIALANRRGSVIDCVRNDLNRIRSTLPQDDRHLIDAHLQSLREVETTYAVPPPVCEGPTLEGGINVTDNRNTPLVSRMHNRVMHAALRCDATRIGSMTIAAPTTGMAYPWANADNSHHALSHEGTPEALEQLININTWHFEEIADLVGLLHSTPEGDGNMLDNTLIVYMNPLSSGQTHSKRDLPITLIGGKWYFDAGQHIRYQGESLGKLLVSLSHAMGVEVDTFGNPNTSDGPLSGITI